MQIALLICWERQVRTHTRLAAVGIELWTFRIVLKGLPNGFHSAAMGLRTGLEKMCRSGNGSTYSLLRIPQAKWVMAPLKVRPTTGGMTIPYRPIATGDHDPLWENLPLSINWGLDGEYASSLIDWVASYIWFHHVLSDHYICGIFWQTILKVANAYFWDVLWRVTCSRTVMFHCEHILT